MRRLPGEVRREHLRLGHRQPQSTAAGSDQQPRGHFTLLGRSRRAPRSDRQEEVERIQGESQKTFREANQGIPQAAAEARGSSAGSGPLQPAEDDEAQVLDGKSREPQQSEGFQRATAEKLIQRVGRKWNDCATKRGAEEDPGAEADPPSELQHGRVQDRRGGERRRAHCPLD